MTKLINIGIASLIFLISCTKNPSGVEDKIRSTASIVSPQNNASLYDSTLIEVSVPAGKGVVKVEIFIDNEIAITLFSSPFRYNWSIISLQDSSIHTLYAKIYGTDSSVTKTSIINVTILKVAPTTVKVNVLNPHEVKLQWTHHTTLASENVVELSEDGGATYVQLESVSSTMDTITVYRSFTAGKDYYFRVGAKINNSIVYSLPIRKSCAITFVKTIKGEPSEDGYDVCQTTDGGYVIGGSSLIKTDAFGNILWKQKYLNVSSVSPTADSNIICLYLSRAIMKVDINGTMLWNKVLSEGSQWDWINNIKQTRGGGFIVLGHTAYGEGNNLRNVLMIKTNDNGDTLWRKTIGGQFGYFAGDIMQTDDNGYIIAGAKYLDGNGNTSRHIIKTDGNGNMLWEQSFGDSVQLDYATHIIQNNDGSYVFSGTSGATSFILTKIDQSGNKIWENKFTGDWGGIGNSVQRASDDGYILTGTGYHTTDGFTDVLLIKTDKNGIKEWGKKFGSTNHDFGRSVRLTIDNGFIITGSYSPPGSGYSDTYLIKTNKDGEVDE